VTFIPCLICSAVSIKDKSIKHPHCPNCNIDNKTEGICNNYSDYVEKLAAYGSVSFFITTIMS